MSAKKKKFPTTKRGQALYRCKLSCQIGYEALDDKSKNRTGATPLEYAVYNLLRAVEDIATAMEEDA